MAALFSNFLARNIAPKGADEALLRAITLSDIEAHDAFITFESEADFENLPWSSYRLLSLLSRRIAKIAPTSLLRPRITSIERAVWVRSRVAVSEAVPLLRLLDEAGIPLMLIKGAGWAAWSLSILQGRLINDIDVCVPPDRIEEAFDIAIANGWQPSGAGSALFHRARLDRATGINLIKGRFGNIDLHRTMFHGLYQSSVDDPEIWKRSITMQFEGLALQVPHPVDAVTIALAHGAGEAHANLDWIIDLCGAMSIGLDWTLLETTIASRKLQAMAALTFDFLKKSLKQPIPDQVIAVGTEWITDHPIAALLDVAEVPARKGTSFLFKIARPIKKQLRLRHRRQNRRDSMLKYRASVVQNKMHAPVDASELKFSQGFDLTKAELNTSSCCEFSVRLQMVCPDKPRKIYIELNTANHHLLRIRAYGRGELEVSFQVPIKSEGEDHHIYLVSCPAQRFNNGDPRATEYSHGAIPFRVIDANFPILSSDLHGPIASSEHDPTSS